MEDKGMHLMAGKKKSDKEKKDKGRRKSPSAGDNPLDHVIEFTPDAGFDIRNAARNFSRMMEDLGQPIIVHLPHVSVEFEPGCTPKEIIDGYNQAMKQKFIVKPSNSNTKSRSKK
jgi:hypothetical protein